MGKLKIMAKQVVPEEQALRDTLSDNIKKYRHRRKWSQFVLAEKANISTNFLADIEAGNTWVSAQTLIKFAQAFEIEAFELLIPSINEGKPKLQQKILNQFSQDLAVVLQEAMEKSIIHVKKQYNINTKDKK